MSANKAMTLTDELKKEIGQHFVFGFHGTSLSQEILTLVAAPYYLGNIILMKRNVTDPNANHQEKGPQGVVGMVSKLQRHAKEAGQIQGLAIGTDQEGGLVSAFSTNGVVTQFPGAMALASISDSTSSTSLEMTRQVYAAQARELSALGVNWVYAPVGDVNSDSRNPVIGVRSFGDDPSKVAAYVSAACQGLVSGGIAPCIKHFPGHGDTHVDSHLGLPRIRKGREQLSQVELVPWRQELLPNNKDSSELVTVMTGHMSLPLITGSQDEPASLSRAVTQGLLRGDLQFEGLVVTDCLEMDAIAKTQGNTLDDEEWRGGPGIVEGAVLALAAGADVVMICHTFEQQVAAVKGVWEALETGRLSLDELRESGQRVRKWKEALGLGWESDRMRSTWDQVKWLKIKGESARISAEAYHRSVVLVKSGDLNRFAATKSLVVCTPAVGGVNKAVDDSEELNRAQDGTIRNTAGASFLAFVDTLRSRAVACDHVVYSKHTPVDHAIDLHGKSIVLALRSADRDTWQIEALRTVLAKGRDVVVVSTSTPYDLVGFSHLSPFAHLACGEYTMQALESVARVILGEDKAVGRLAVAVD